MSTLLAQARQGEALDAEIIDSHGHVGRYAFAIPDVSPRSMVESMDRLGIRTILCSSMRAASQDVESGNAEVLEAMQAHRGRILGYVAVYPFDQQQVRRSVERWLEAGFIGLKFHNQNGFAYDEPAYEPAYAIANERSLPLLFHTWGAESGLGEIGAIADRHPQASFLLAHSGVSDEEVYVELARRHANVYLELCVSRSPRGLVARLVEAVGAEKVIWGSDCCFLNIAQQLGKAIGADVPDQTKRLILGENIKRILDKAQMR